VRHQSGFASMDPNKQVRRSTYCMYDTRLTLIQHDIAASTNLLVWIHRSESALVARLPALASDILHLFVRSAPRMTTCTFKLSCNYPSNRTTLPNKNTTLTYLHYGIVHTIGASTNLLVWIHRSESALVARLPALASDIQVILQLSKQSHNTT
jgi:hypothetical protein